MFYWLDIHSYNAIEQLAGGNVIEFSKTEWQTDRRNKSGVYSDNKLLTEIE